MVEQLTPEQMQELQEIARLPPEEQRQKLSGFMGKLSPGQIEALKQMQTQATPQCIFCKISSHEVPAKIVYEDDEFIAFLDIKPANPGHTLVIPKKHYQFLPQMPDDEVARMFTVVKKMAAAVFEATGAEGVEIRQRNGAVAGQVVPHVHTHIIPRFKDDGIATDWAPRQLKEEQFDEMQKRISEKMKDAAPKVYDMSGKLIEEKPKQEKGKKKKSKLPKVPPRLP